MIFCLGNIENEYIIYLQFPFIAKVIKILGNKIRKVKKLCRLWVVGHGLWVMGYGSWAMGHGSWVVGHGLWVMGFESWVVCHGWLLG